MKDQYKTVMSMGNLSGVVSMIPGMNSNMITKEGEKMAASRIKKFLTIMDSMTDFELDSNKQLTDSRIKRIARGAGASMAEMNTLIEEHKRFADMIKKMSKNKVGS